MNRNLLLAAFVLLILTSCSKEETGDSDSSQTKLVQRESIREGQNIEYRYNDNNQLVQITEVFPEEDIDDIISYRYDSNGNVVEREIKSNSTGYQSTVFYQYDSQNRLVNSEMNSSMEESTSFQFSYDSNNITVTRDYRGYENTFFLKVNELNQIIEITRGNSHSTFNYGAKGNLKMIQTFDNEGELDYTLEYSYDDKPNPFYGKLRSLYLPKFIEIMEDLSYGEHLVFPYQGYDFPFLRNNIKKIESNSYGDDIYAYEYSYDSDGYPTEITETFNGDSEFLLNLIYN